MLLLKVALRKTGAVAVAVAVVVVVVVVVVVLLQETHRSLPMYGFTHRTCPLLLVQSTCQCIPTRWMTFIDRITVSYQQWTSKLED